MDSHGPVTSPPRTKGTTFCPHSNALRSDAPDGRICAEFLSPCFRIWQPPLERACLRLGMPPRTQNPVQYWQLRSRLSVEQAAQRIGISPDRYRVVVVAGSERFTDEEIRQVPAATDSAR